MIGSALVVLAKAPRPGQVKTRLCPPLSPPDAARVHAAFVRDTVERMRSLAGVQLVCAYTPAEDRAFFEAACDGAMLVAQAGGDLGGRLHAVFAALGARGFPRIVAIGADTPTLPLVHVRDAFALLGESGVDVVLGPAEDGGYYLIGLRTPCAELFADIPWSTDRVFAETWRRAEAIGLRAQGLPAWRDVDTFADLTDLAKAMRDDPHAARHTRGVLSELRLL